MAGLADVVQGAFAGGKPGPSSGVNVDAESTLANPQMPREGGELIMMALAGKGGSSRKERARKRLMRNRSRKA